MKGRRKRLRKESGRHEGRRGKKRREKSLNEKNSMQRVPDRTLSVGKIRS